MSSLRKRTRLLSVAIFFIITLFLIRSYHHHISHISPTPNAKLEALPTLEILDWTPKTPPRIAIAATSPPNTNTRSLPLWSAYASRFDHDLHIQHTPIVRGFANPLIWLHHVIASEIIKDTGDKAEWIVCIDPSLTLPSTSSLQLTHFLPPPSFPGYATLTFIGTKSNDHDINTALFYIRVSSLSLRLLTLAMAAVYLDPKRDWGEDVAGAALREVLEREGYRDKGAWIPGGWWDGDEAAFVKMDGREGGLGFLHKEKLLANVEAKKDERERIAVPSKQEVKAFWGLVGEALSVLEAGKGKEEEVGEEMKGLRDVVELRTWDVRVLVKAMESLKEKLGLGKFIGFDPAVE